MNRPRLTVLRLMVVVLVVGGVLGTFAAARRCFLRRWDVGMRCVREGARLYHSAGLAGSPLTVAEREEARRRAVALQDLGWLYIRRADRPWLPVPPAPEPGRQAARVTP